MDMDSAFQNKTSHLYMRSVLKWKMGSDLVAQGCYQKRTHWPQSCVTGPVDIQKTTERLGEEWFLAWLARERGSPDPTENREQYKLPSNCSECMGFKTWSVYFWNFPVSTFWQWLPEYSYFHRKKSCEVGRRGFCVFMEVHNLQFISLVLNHSHLVISDVLIVVVVVVVVFAHLQMNFSHPFFQVFDSKLFSLRNPKIN